MNVDFGALRDHARERAMAAMPGVVVDGEAMERVWKEHAAPFERALLLAASAFVRAGYASEARKVVLLEALNRCVPVMQGRLCYAESPDALDYVRAQIAYAQAALATDAGNLGAARLTTLEAALEGLRWLWPQARNVLCGWVDVDGLHRSGALADTPQGQKIDAALDALNAAAGAERGGT